VTQAPDSSKRDDSFPSASPGRPAPKGTLQSMWMAPDSAGVNAPAVELL
jgi:hypothetical protein